MITALYPAQEVLGREINPKLSHIDEKLKFIRGNSPVKALIDNDFSIGRYLGRAGLVLSNRS